MEIIYAVEPNLSVEEFISVLERSTLAERRPVQDAERIAGMLRAAQVICTARCSGELVGVARALTDFVYCSYLSDLAVDVAHQREGIGRKLVRNTHQACGEQTMLILLAAPKAANYYPHIGMTQHNSCWTIPGKAVPNPPRA